MKHGDDIMYYKVIIILLLVLVFAFSVTDFFLELLIFKEKDILYKPESYQVLSQLTQCSDYVMNSAMETFSESTHFLIPPFEPANTMLVISIALAPFAFILCCLIVHYNANLIIIQSDMR